MRSDLLELLRAQPGGEAVLGCASHGVHLVGGSVRDLLLGRRPRELDVVVEGDIEPLLAALGGESTEHERFGTATVRLGEARIDIAQARRERYPQPGALPVVEPAPLGEDLLRRDFTVNAIALGLAGEQRGELREAPGAREDLEAGRLRVLHAESFREDPTRLWRLGRYGARLGFETEAGTARLARQALDAGALGTVSGARHGAELRLALAEEDAPTIIAALALLGVLNAVGVGSGPGEGALIAARELLPADGRRDLLYLDALLGAAEGAGGKGDGGTPPGAPDRGRVAALLDDLEFTASDRDRVLAALGALPALVAALPADPRPSELHTLASAAPPEAVALAAALSAQAEGASGDGRAGAARRVAERWLAELRHVRLQINGDDLIAAGVAQGPQIGRGLEAALRLRLDGELEDAPAAELRAALEAAR